MRMISCLVGLLMAVSVMSVQAADAWQHVTNPPLPSSEIQLVKLGAHSNGVWIGTPGGLARAEGGVLRVMMQTKKLSVWDVTERPEGGYWIGHSSGALLVNGDQTAQAMNGLNVPKIQIVGTQLWAIAKQEATDRNTLMRAGGNDWVPEELFKGRNVLDLIKDAKGIFWLVLDGDGVVEVDPVKPLSAYRHHLRKMNVTSILSDSQGRVWCGLMNGGVMERQNNEWKNHLDKENSAVLSLLDDGNGNIWAATSGSGIRAYDGKAWKSMLPEADYVNMMNMTSDKRIWISTQQRGGLRYWNGTEWKSSLEVATPLNSLVELPHGVLLAGSARDGMFILGNYNIKGE